MTQLPNANVSTSGLFGLFSKASFMAEEAERGTLYAVGERRPATGYQQIITIEHENALRAMLAKIGLTNLAALLKFEVYKEKTERTKWVYAPIRSHIIKVKLWLLRQSLALANTELEKSRSKGVPEVEIQKLDLWAEREYLSFVLQHINEQAAGELNFRLPRILITDMQEVGLSARFPKVLHDLNPSELVHAPGIPLAELVREIVGDDILQAEILHALQVIAPGSGFVKPEHTWDNAVAYTIQGAVHEVSHFLAGYAPPNMEDALLDLFLEMKDIPHFPKATIERIIL
jgi:hypothetical protein